MISSGKGTDIPNVKKREGRFILQAVLSLLVSSSCFGLSVLFLIIVSGENIFAGELASQGMVLTIALIFLAIGLMILPAGISAIYRIRDLDLPGWLRSSPDRQRFFLRFSIPLWLITLASGWLMGNHLQIGKILLSMLGIIAISIPVYWLVTFGSYKLNADSVQRKYGLLALALTGTPILIITVEVVVLLVGLLGFSIYAANKPELMDNLLQLGMRLSAAGSDLDKMLEILQPYLSQPSVIFWVLAAISVFAPLIEESLKTLGIWFLPKRQLTPSEGYVAGLISGAGFALIEGMFSLVNATDGQTWLLLILGRVGGSLIHVFMGGLIGWGLVSTWRQGNPLKFIGTFLLSLIIHGLWNAIAVAAAILPGLFQIGFISDAMSYSFYYLPLIFLGILVFISFILFSLMLRKRSHQLEVTA